jgi:hypothetical protein
MVDWVSSSKKSPNANKKVEPCKGILLQEFCRFCQVHPLTIETVVTLGQGKLLGKPA